MIRRSLMAMGFGVLGLIGWSMFADESWGPPVNWLMAAEGPNVSVKTPLQPKDNLKATTLRNSGIYLAGRVRPATKKESPEDLQLKKLPKAVPPGQLRRPSKKELTDLCNKRPNCRKKLQAIKTRKGQRKPRPAAKGDTLEDRELKKLPKALRPKHLPRRQPRTELLMPSETSSVLSWLNPLLPEAAYAQSPVSIVLTPGGPYIGSNLQLLGVRVYYNDRFYLSSTDRGYNSANAENKSHAYIKFYVPSTGDYLINISAGRGKAKLRHQSGGPIIDTWDFRNVPYGTYNYLTAEYLAQGNHYFYFWPDDSGFYIYSVSLESYP